MLMYKLCVIAMCIFICLAPAPFLDLQSQSGHGYKQETQINDGRVAPARSDPKLLHRPKKYVII